MQFKPYSLLLSIGLACAAFSTGVLAGLDEGITAYGKKDYATALHELKPLAQQGDAPAQYLSLIHI